MLKKILFAVVSVCLLACTASSKNQKLVNGVNDIKPEAQQGVVIQGVVSLIENYSFKKIVVNDSISSLVLDRYIKSIDPARQYFLASDIKEFEKFRYTLDDDFRNGDLSSTFYIFNVYLKRYNDCLRFSLSQMNTHFDYYTKDVYVYDRSKLPWLSSQASLDSLWRKKLQYEMVSLKIANDNNANNIKVVTKRYKNLQTQIAKINNQDVFQAVMNALTAAFDPHTNYFNPVNAQRFNEDMSRSMEGIGARLQLDNEVVKIVDLIAGGPAARSKLLKRGDRIIGVAQGNEEFENVIGWRIDNIVSKIKGPKGTSVRLKVIAVGDELTAKPKIITLIREKIILEELSAKKEVKTLKRNGQSYKIGIINLPDFYMDFAAFNAGEKNYKSTTRDVRKLIDTLKNQDKVDAIVMDLRSNGGGSLLEAINLTGLFIKTGPVVQVKNLGGSIEIQEDLNDEIAWNGPLTVMVDRFSASASEIFAAAIQDYGRGIIVGTQTYGKGTVQQQINLNNVLNPSILQRLSTLITGNSRGRIAVSSNDKKVNLGQINLTTAKFYRISGSSTQHKGVMPDVMLPSSYDITKFGESAEVSALPWDEISKSNFQKVGNLSEVKQALVDAHTSRMSKSLDYQLLLEDIDNAKKQDKKTSVTLNIVKLKAERDSLEAVALNKKNTLRVSRGLKPIKKGEKNIQEDTFDLIKNENLEIIGDLIELNKTKKG